jgi:hypothetical protein
MRFLNRALVVAALLAATAHAAAAPGSSLNEVRWLAGQWVAEPSGKLVLETWREVSAATFEGSGVTTDRADGAERGFKLQFRRPGRT